MKIACLFAKSDRSSLFYRVEQWIPHLEEKGIHVSLLLIPEMTYERIALMLSLKGYDLVLLQRRLLGFMHFALLTRFSRRLLFDMDDALFLKDSRDGRDTSRTRTNRFRRTVRKANLVVCGNPWLEKKVRPYNPRTAVLPTVMDLSGHDTLKEHTGQEGFTAVWIGSASTLLYLEEILPWLEPLAQEIPGFKLRVIGDRFPEKSLLPVEKVTWARATEKEALLAGDVGLMPLMEDDWCQGKCGLKLIQYGAAGLPSVCSPVGVNRKVVKHGKTGFHASNPAQWQEALRSLAADPALRTRMGREARTRMEKHYSLQAHLEPFVKILRKCAGKEE